MRTEYTLIDDAGNEYPLSQDPRTALEISGIGMPPIRHWVTRSPFQVGLTHWGYTVQARPVVLTVVTKACQARGLYSAQIANVAMLNPVNSPLKLRCQVPDSPETYELHEGWYLGGYELRTVDRTLDGAGIWNQVADVEIEFMDPMWKWTDSPLDVGETRDADGRTCVASNTWVITAALVLPFTGPYLLGVSPGTLTMNVTNDGTAAVRPLITLEGPTEDWVLTNTTNGDYIYSDGTAIAAAEIWTIDVVGKTATSSVSGDVSTYLRGDMATFELDPGLNALSLFSSDGAVNGTTELTVCWFLEMLGI